VEGNKYLSLQRASKLSRYSQEYLSLRARQGKLKAVKRGRNWITTKEWLDEYIRSAEEYKEVHEGFSIKKFLARKSCRFLLSPAVWAGILFISGYLFSHTSPIEFTMRATDNLNNFLYTSSVESGATVKKSYLSLSRSVEELKTTALSSTTAPLRQGSAGQATISPLDFIQGKPLSFAQDITSDAIALYKQTDRKVSRFFADTYIKLVEALLPGYSFYGTRLAEETILNQLRHTIKELDKLEREGLTVKEITKEVQRITQIEPIREITKEIIIADESGLIAVAGDLVRLQRELKALEEEFSQSGPTFTQDRVTNIENYITQNIIQGNVAIPNDIFTSTLELHTRSGKVGLIVDQQSTSDIVIFQDNGTTVFSIVDGGATTVTTINGIITLDTSNSNNNILLNAGTGNLIVTASTTNLSGGLAINGGDLTTTQSTFNILNNTPTTINFGSNANNINIGSSSSQTTFNNDVLINGNATTTGVWAFSSGLTSTSSLILDNTVGSDPLIQFQDNGTDEWFVGFDNSDSDKFRIARGAFDTDSTGLTITEGGNVGIGTTNPTQVLSIAGNLNFTGTSTISTDTGDLTISSAGEINITSAASTTLTSTSGTLTVNATGQTIDIDGAVIDIDGTIVTLDGSTSVSLGTTTDVPFDIDTAILDIDSSGNITIDTSNFSSFALTTASSTSFTTTDGTITLDTSTGNNQIQLTTGSGEIDLTTTGLFDLNSGNLDIDSATTTIDTAAGTSFSIDGNFNSNVSVTSGTLTLSTITSGDLILTSAGVTDINAGANLDIDVTGTYDMLSTGIFSIDGTGNSNISATSGNLTLSTLTSGDVIITTPDILNLDSATTTIDASVAACCRYV